MGYKAAIFGEALFDLIEHKLDHLQAHIGGSPFNVARSFARQAIDTHYLSPISTDRYGDRLHAYALAEGMHLPKNNRSFLPTSLALVYTDENGQPDYRLYRKHIADLDIDSSTLLSMLPNDLALFHTGSLALVPSMLEVLTECFKALKEKGVFISIDINMRKGVEQDEVAYIHAVKSLLTYADIIKVSDEDLELLGIELPPEEGAKQILSQLDDGVVLLTQGEHGATLLTDAISLNKPVFKPKQFVDAVGAGDTFFSAFLSEVMRAGALNRPWQQGGLDKALTFGLMAATLNVERNGCQPPTQEEVKAALTLRICDC